MSTDDHDRDDAVRRLVEDNLDLADRLARRYSIGAGTDVDLRQVAALGLVGAAQRYNPAVGPFQPFAIATILGELKKYLRTAGWTVRVPRRLQETSITVANAVEALEQENRRSPTPAEVGERTGLPVEDVLDALHARSYRFPATLPGVDPATQPVVDDIVDHLDLMRAMVDLSGPDRELLELRFSDELSQRQVAERLGTSQAQVHRRLVSVLARLRSHLVNPDEAAK